jgi:predicted phage-related endonuclease
MQPRATDPARLAWLNGRTSTVGASEVSALFSMNDDGTWPNRFQSALSLYYLKRGLVPESTDDNAAIEWGIRMEPVAAEWFADVSGRKLIDHGRYYSITHPTARLSCTLDREQYPIDDRGPGALELKAPSPYVKEAWKASGVPLSAQIQLQAQLAVTGWDWGTICAQFPHEMPLYWDVERNDTFIAALLAKVAWFWKCVDEGTAPEADSHPATTRALKQLHPNDTGESVTLPEAADEWCASLEEADATIEMGTNVRETMRNRLRAAIGDATFGETPMGALWSYKTNSKGVRALKRIDK